MADEYFAQIELTPEQVGQVHVLLTQDTRFNVVRTPQMSIELDFIAHGVKTHEVPDVVIDFWGRIAVTMYAWQGGERDDLLELLARVVEQFGYRCQFEEE